MVPELQKGRVYYRCKLVSCPTKTIRQDVLEHTVRSELATLQLNARAGAAADKEANTNTKELAAERTGLELQIRDEERRLDRLQDLLLDDAISIDTFKQKQNALQQRLARLREKLRTLPDPVALRAHRTNLAELRKNLVFLYANANRTEKRCLVEYVWPNRTVAGKQPLLEPDSWLERAICDRTLTEGEPERDRCRTLIYILDRLRRGQRDAGDDKQSQDRSE